MQASLVSALRDRRPKVREQWEALLRAAPVGTPLGHPDALVHLIDWTLDEVFGALANPLAAHRLVGSRFATNQPPACPCGRNPLLVYFAAGGQAMREALAVAQVSSCPFDATEPAADLEELNLILRHVSRREIEAFCGVCQYRKPARECHLAETMPLAQSVSV